MTTGADRWEPVAARLQQAEQDGAFSGTVLVTVGERTEFEACHGLADRAAGTPVHPGTRFAVASMCKMFTAVAVLDAVRRGEVTLDAAVAEVLPADRRPSTLRPDVTVHHLLCHTSGIADYAEEGEDLPFYVADYAELWHDLPCYRIQRVADFLPMFTDRPPIGPPGEVFRYSNAGYLLLGLVVEEVTGGGFNDVVTERVLVPCGMADSGYLRMDEVHPDVATGYLRPEQPDGAWRSNIYSVPVVGGPDGGALATAADIDRFLRAVEQGAVVGPELRDLMMTPHVPAGKGESMGYGLYLGQDGWFGHDGGDPGVEAMAQRLPQLDTTVVVLANVEGSLEVAWHLVWDTARG
jgi:CubicO group peptidase (beta-lactamase class C family)